MQTPGSSEAVTEGIRITATAFYLPDDSDPDARQYRFGYRISMQNEGIAPATLVSRRWLIIDANGNAEEVEGLGVVGQSPRLEPEQAFKYTSYCPLRTAWGTMEGHYVFERDDGTEFKAKIGRFYLVMPKHAAAKTPAGSGEAESR
jgi:ApaG protein